jgi:predicted transcriptional regulator
MVFSDKVHIAPVGYEHDRVVHPLEDDNADYIVLIRHSEDDPKGERYLERIEESLADLEVEWETLYCDLFNLYESIETFGQAVSEFESEDTYINISTGSKITAVAGFIVATVTDTDAYYTKAENYDEDPVGYGPVQELPHYPIERPNDQQTTILTVLHRLEEEDVYPTKGDLIHISEQNNLDFTKQNVAEKGKYRLLDTKILDPLEERGYVEIIKDGKYRRVRLTPEGEKAYLAFSVLTDSDPLDLGTVSD